MWSDRAVARTSSVRGAHVVRTRLKEAAVEGQGEQCADDVRLDVGGAEFGGGLAVFLVFRVPCRLVRAGVGRERVALGVLVALFVQDAVEVGLERTDLVEIIFLEDRETEAMHRRR